MAFEKKICFGFTKTVRQNTSLQQRAEKKETVQYIDCLDSKNIICRTDEDKGKEEKESNLVIPLTRNNESTKVQKTEEDKSSKEDNPSEDVVSEGVQHDTEKSNQQTLEDKAVKEILEGVKEPTNDKDETMFSGFVIPKTKSRPEVSIEPTLEDYEHIPIGAFGKAMLRGMGWNPDKGIGKTQRVVTTEVPLLRPRGMGLGADKQQVSTVTRDETDKEEKLEIVKGAFIQVVSGSRRGQYGQIEGFDDHAGRVIVKMAMEGSPVTLSEHAIKLVTKKNYERNSRVLNVTKYEEYKEKTTQSDCNEKVRERTSSPKEETGDRKRNRSHTPSKRRRHSSSSSAEENERRSSSSTNRKKHEKRSMRFYQK